MTEMSYENARLTNEELKRILLGAQQEMRNSGIIQQPSITSAGNGPPRPLPKMSQGTSNSGCTAPAPLPKPCQGPRAPVPKHHVQAPYPLGKSMSPAGSRSSASTARAASPEQHCQSDPVLIHSTNGLSSLPVHQRSVTMEDALEQIPRPCIADMSPKDRRRSTRRPPLRIRVPQDYSTVEAAALALSSAQYGAIIEVAAGHREEGHVSLDVPGVDVIGYKLASQRPHIAGASVTTSSVTLRNLDFSRLEISGTKNKQEALCLQIDSDVALGRECHLKRAKGSTVRALSAPADLRTSCLRDEYVAQPVVVEGCHFSPDSCARAAIVIDCVEACRLLGNELELPFAEGRGRLEGVDGVEIQRSSNVYICGNTFLNGRDQVSIADSQATEVTANCFAGDRRHSLFVAPGCDADLHDNRFLDGAVFAAREGGKVVGLDEDEELGFEEADFDFSS